MTKHQPVVSKHGTDCICGVFCGSARESWYSHAEDQLLLHPGETELDFRPTTPGLRAVQVAMTAAGEKVQRAFRHLAEQLKPVSQALRAAGWRPEPTCETCGHMSDMDLLYAMAKCTACGRSGSHLLPQITAKRGGIDYGSPGD